MHPKLDLDQTLLRNNNCSEILQGLFAGRMMRATHDDTVSSGLGLRREKWGIS
jgi:hypothetical protein